MILLDTHAWLWLATAPALLSARATRAIRQARRLGLAAVSCFEFAVLVERGRIEVDRSPLEWIERSLATHDIELFALTPAVAVRATQLGSRFHRDPADRQIVATALIHGCSLVTKDQQIRNSDLVTAIW